MKTTFSQLDDILIQYAFIWRESPFSTPEPSWLEIYPNLKEWLMRLSDDDVDKLQGDDALLCEVIAPCFPIAQGILSLIQIPFCDTKPSIVRTYAWQRDVPGRKVEQIEAFSAATGEIINPLIEWCSGKLHLGRYLAEQYNVPALGLEINNSLVQQANQLASRMNSRSAKKIDARVEQCDVLGVESEQRLNDEQHAIALHACGGLHVSLLEKSVKKQVKRITLSPCCYHRFNQSDIYQPLSSIAKNSQLVLNSEDLRSAVRQSNTAAEREREKRKQLQRWRLGFDELQRDVRAVDEYLPVPSLSIKLLTLSFRQFCMRVADIKGIVLPEGVDYGLYEVRGEQRFFEYSRYELVRMTFRRALECWLVMDRAMYLEENDYDCTLSQFCSTSLTPRNLFIDARLR